ncbi:acyltransferase family protein [Delftia acidovorans]
MTKNLSWIQALRGIAALMVLFFHMSPHWELAPALTSVTGVMKWGFSGVDIFFALSGFVVYRSSRRTVASEGLWIFVKKRLLRIYLGYWPVLILIALTTIFIYNESLPNVKKMVFSTLLLYPNIWDNWLPPAWSLTMEIYFYMWIALITLLPQHHQLKGIVCALLMLTIWNAGWLIADRPSVFVGQQPLRYLLTGLGLEFLAGALISHVYSQGQHFSRSHLWIPVCVILACASLALGMTSPYFDRVEIMRATSFGVMGISVVVLALSLEQTRLTPPAWLVSVGDASYSLYLLHTFLLDISGRLRLKYQINSPSELLAFMLALPVVIVLISMCWYRWVEKPIMARALPAGNKTPAPSSPVGLQT